MESSITYKNLFNYKKDFFCNHDNMKLDVLSRMNNIRKDLYQWDNLIDLVSYYLEPRFILSQNNYNFGDYDNQDLHVRTDTNATKVANNSCTAFIGMLLPEDIMSFKIKWENTALQLESSDKLDTLDTLRQLERKVNMKIWDKLKDPEIKFIMTINLLVRDYLNYGTSTAIYKGNRWRYIPYLRSSIGKINKSYAIAYFKHRYDFMSNGTEKDKYKHYLYVKDNSGRYVKFSNETTKIDEPEEAFNSTGEYADDFDIVVSKMDDTGELYGIGCGMQVLNSLIDSNMYNNCLRLNSISVFHPANAIALDYEIAKISNSYTGRTVYDRENLYKSGDNLIKLNLLPGMVYSLKRDQDITPTNQPPITVLSRPAEFYEMFKTMKYETVAEIEDKYFLSITNKLSTMEGGPAKTNDEIKLISQMAFQQFKGVVEPFYLTTVYPMVRSYCQEIINEVAITFKEDVDKIRSIIYFDPNDFYLETSNLVASKTKEQEDIQFSNWIGLLANIEGAIDQSVIDKIKRKSLDYIK